MTSSSRSSLLVERDVFRTTGTHFSGSRSRRSRDLTSAAASRLLKSVCRSCHGGCGVLLHVTDGRLMKVEGDPDSPLNHGRLCPIGTVTLDLVYHPDRLRYPLRRLGPRGSGQWQRISWDLALDEISERL